MTDPVVMESMMGHVHGVFQVFAGHTLAVAASVDDTVLFMADTSDYSEEGGQVLVSGDVYDYTGIDSEADTITLATPLTSAAAYEDPVDVYDPEVGEIVVVGHEATVLLDDADPTGRPITVDVPHGLVALLEESTRGGPGEAVTLIRDGEHNWTIYSIVGKVPSIDGALIRTPRWQGALDTDESWADATWTGVVFGVDFGGATNTLAYDDTTGVVTANEPGNYLIATGAGFAGDPTGARGVRIMVDNIFATGAVVREIRIPVDGAGDVSIEATRVWFLDRGDNIYVEAFQNSGGAIDLLALHTNLELIRVSP